jgi:hypothetical protein
LSEPEDPLDLLHQIEASEGERVSRHLRPLQVTGRIFTMNAQELQETLTAFNRPPLVFQLWAVDNRELFQEYYGEVIRHLHNFLASASTLADHVNAVVGKLYSDQSFESEYRRKVSESFKSSGLATFVQDLRNYMLHKGLPPTTARLSSEACSGTVRNAVYLNKGALLNWESWSSRSREFMAALPADLDLLEVVISYKEIVNSFYAWLHQRLQEIHEPDLKGLEDPELRFNAARGSGTARDSE